MHLCAYCPPAAKLMAIACLVFLAGLAGCGPTGPESTTADADSSIPLPSVADSLHPQLVRQPEYSGTPRYCVIAIGPQRDKQMWVAIDKHTLYVDLNANGDLTEPDEQIEGEVEMEFKGTTYVNFFIGTVEHESILHSDANVRAAITEDDVRASVTMFLDGFVESANNSHILSMQMNPDMSLAPVVHFGGPVSMGLYHEPQAVVVGEEMEFYAMVGTPGDGIGTLTALSHADIPKEISPKVEFVFPHQDATQPDIEVTAYLTERC